jgi:hypothetical protein
MRTFKFLAEDGHSVYSGTHWPLPSGERPGVWRPGAWLETTTVDPCRTGIHACAAGDLAYWLSATLWEIELDGDVVELRHKVVARRGRLVRPISDYSDGVRALCHDSAWRTRDRAVTTLRADGRESLADRFAACTTLSQVEGLGPVVENDLDPATPTARVASIASDCAHWADDLIQHSPFIAAIGAGDVAADFDTGYSDERRYQSRWLATRLALD